jgi:hypothetical protein
LIAGATIQSVLADLFEPANSVFQIHCCMFCAVSASQRGVGVGERTRNALNADVPSFACRLNIATAE